MPSSLGLFHVPMISRVGLAEGVSDDPHILLNAIRRKSEHTEFKLLKNARVFPIGGQTGRD
jgi:hypothetical protein